MCFDDIERVSNKCGENTCGRVGDRGSGKMMIGGGGCGGGGGGGGGACGEKTSK